MIKTIAIIGWSLHIVSPFFWRWLFDRMDDELTNKNAIFGKYPCCEFVNNAIRFILDGKTDAAVEELVQCIYKSDGYLHEDLQERVNEVHERYWDEHRKPT